MSPVSPVFHTEVIVSIGLKNKLRVVIGEKQDWVRARFQIEVLTHIQNLMENRLRHARGHVHFTKSVTYIKLEWKMMSRKTQQVFLKL